MPARILFLLLFALGAEVSADEVYKWTDEAGKLHYGNVPPEELKQPATKVEEKIFEPTAQQREQAQQLINRDKQRATNLQRNRARTVQRQPAVGGQATPASDCEAQIRLYEESMACFEQYRVVGGGLRGEAFKACKEIKRPACYEPPSK